MSVTMIEELRGKRKGLLDEMRSIQSTAEAADRDLTAEEAAEFERREADFDSITGRVERLEKLEGLAKETQGENPAVRDVTPEAAVVSADPEEQRAIEIRAFENVLRHKGNTDSLDKEERAALQVDTNSEGGFTVPKAFLAQLVESMREFGVINSLATHISSSESGELSVPSVATNATAAWTAEEAPFTQSEGTFGQIVLKAYKVGAISKISDELIHDSAFDLLSWLAKDQGEALGLKTGEAYAMGATNSTTTPKGLLLRATQGVETAANNAVTTDEFIDLYHSVRSPYRANGVWLVNDATVKVIRKFKEGGTNQYLWQPGLQAGQPDSFLGRPLYTDPNIDTLAATKRIAVFGDISKGYVIRDVEGTSVKVLNELYAANGQVGFRSSLRTDGDLWDAQAVKALAVKA
jgi:HK97 family phage major capsid protein